MQLDPQMKALLDQLAAGGGKPFHFGTPQEARAGINALIGLVAGAPEKVAKIEDRKIPGPAGQIPVRIYTPSVTAPMGALVFFHGGGWVVGDINRMTCCADRSPTVRAAWWFQWIIAWRRNTNSGRAGGLLRCDQVGFR